MKNKLEYKLSQLIKSQKQLLNQVEGLTPAEINYQPEKDQWSVGQVLYHLYLVERLTLDYMKEKRLEIDSLAKTGLKESWRTFLMKISLKLPIKFKAPTSVKENIPHKIDLEKLSQDWAITHEGYNAFIDEFPANAYHSKIFRHPRIGKINLNQTLSFIQDHFDHHLPQVKNLLSKTKSA